jgi:hypothetical protein
MAYDIERTLQYFPGALHEIAAAQMGKRVKVVKVIAKVA